MVRTRIAPSPTGEDLHIGNLYTALINFAVARKNKGKFIIRIEDTDRQRYIKGAEEKILSTLCAYSLLYDEGPDIGGPYAPYRQSERLEKYKEYAKMLIHKGKAYYCFCTKERLEKLRQEQLSKKQTPRYDKYCIKVQSQKSKVKSGESYVIRLNVLPNKTVWFDDVIRGRIEFSSSALNDQVLIKSDGYPTYHMGVVVDDYLMKVSHVIRAEEWISSTPKHVILYEALGWPLPIFAHVPILRNSDKSKLSKRKNPVWASWYLSQGFLPEAVLNFLALMGWSHPEEKEIFSQEEFIRLFELKDIKPVGPIFDIEKLKWMNGAYIREIKNEKLKMKIFEFFDGKYDKEMIEKILPLAKERMNILSDFEILAGHFFHFSKVSPQDDKKKKIAQTLFEKFETIDSWNKDEILKNIRDVLSAYSIKMPIVYYILTGTEQGLPLPESLEILGKEETLKRLKHFK